VVWLLPEERLAFVSVAARFGWCDTAWTGDVGHADDVLRR
jgi:hypothetical protein